MPVDLRKPLHWTRADRAERALLADLQGNILKSHGRDHADHVILRFDPRAPAEARAFLRSLRGRVKTARRQLSEAAAYRRGVSGEVFVGLALSSAGYQVLGIPRARWPR